MHDTKVAPPQTTIQANYEEIYKAFNRYKFTIPVYGAILMDGKYRRFGN